MLLRKPNMKIRARKGIAFSIEMLLIVAVVATLLYVVVSNMGGATKKLEVGTLSANVTQLVQDTKSLFRKQSSFASITSAVLVSNGIVPFDMVSGTNIVAFNNNVAVAAVAPSSFSLTFNGVDKAVCSGFVTSVEGVFHTVSVGGTSVKAPGTALNPISLSTGCSAGSGAVVTVIGIAGRN